MNAASTTIAEQAGGRLGRALHAMRRPPVPQWSTSAGLASAVAATLVGGLLQVALLPPPSAAPFAAFYVSCAVAAWLGGRLPGLLAVALAAIAVNFALPAAPPPLGGPGLGATAMFAAGASLVALVCASLREATLAADRSAAALRRQSEMIALSHDAIFSWTLDGPIDSWSPGAAEMYGYGAEEAVGQPVHALLKTVFPVSLEAIGAALQATGRWEGEVTHTTKAGRVITVSARLQVAGSGAALRVLQTDRDITPQKQAQEALRASARAERRSAVLLRALAESIPDPVFAKDAESRYVLANPAALEAIGKTATQVLGRSGPDDPEATRALVEVDRRVMGSGETVVSDERYVTPRGVRDFLVTKAPLRDEEGAVFGVVGIARDITERKRAEEELRAQEQRLRLFVEHAPAAIAMFDRQMRYLAASRRYLEDYHLPYPDLVGRSHYEVFPEIPERWIKIHQRCLAGAVESCDEDRFQRADGSVDWVRWEIHPWRTAAGEIGGLILFSEVITARKRSAESLRESEARLRMAQKVARVGTFEWNLETGVNSWTPELEAMYGLEPGGFARTEAAWESLVHPDDRVEAMGRADEALKTGEPVEHEWRVRWPDGSVHWIAGRFQSVRDPAGRPQRLIGVNFDITERKRVEELRASEAALRQADRQKNEFLALLSHELRNPLAPVRNSLYILTRASPGGEQARRAVAVIERQVEHLTRLIDDLLDVTRITRGKVRLQRERLDLNALAKAVVEDQRTVFAHSSVTLKLQLARSEVWVDGDRTRLAQVVGNLLQNAAKFTPAGGQTTLSVQADPAARKAVLVVEDTGSGIAPEALPHLFTAFVQADATLARSRHGLGLGLALVRGLVELHGGSVQAESAGLDRGARFTVSLPLDTSAPEEIAAGVGARRRDEAARAPHPRRVLVIEDNADAADSLREALELNGHAVAVAYGGREGLEKARSFAPEVVICAIGLSDFDGYEVARRARARRELDRVALVALSGHAMPEDVARASDAGFDAHLAKPPGIEDLERTLAQAARARAGEDHPQPHLLG